jgi:hypothetical protein
MDWLGNKLGYCKLSDWYNVKLSDFLSNYGQALVTRYHHSPSSVVSHIYPEHDWKVWLFSEASNMFWSDAHNIEHCICSCHFISYFIAMHCIRYGMVSQAA